MKIEVKRGNNFNLLSILQQRTDRRSVTHRHALSKSCRHRQQVAVQF